MDVSNLLTQLIISARNGQAQDINDNNNHKRVVLIEEQRNIITLALDILNYFDICLGPRCLNS